MNGDNVPPCQYFLRSSCLFGDQCWFSHSNAVALPPVPNQSDRNQDIGRDLRRGGNSTRVNGEVNGTVEASSSGNTNRYWTRRNKSKKIKQVATSTAVSETNVLSQQDDLCPFTVRGKCRFHARKRCNYLHPEVCEYCQIPVLHPTDEEQRKIHIKDCVEHHKRNKEHSLAIARSKEKSCAVCYDIVMKKGKKEQRFGLMSNCDHCFCLTCIRRWRNSKQFRPKVRYGCPECRIVSDFVCPSSFWPDSEGKKTLISDYKKALSEKHCKYFKKGEGKCPFGNECFYLHALPDGTKFDVGPRQPIRQNYEDIDPQDLVVLLESSLLDFIAIFVGDFQDESDWSD